MAHNKKDKGLTKNNVESYGAVLVVYYMDRDGPVFLMGGETSYLNESKYVKNFKTEDGEDIFKAFLSPGIITNKDQLKTAKAKFTNVCKQIENSFQGRRFIGHVTFDEPKTSSQIGFISSKPRYINMDKRDRLGFIKGGYKKGEDTSIERTAIRECLEETSIELDIMKLTDCNKQFFTDSKKEVPYSLFKYELTELEYKSIVDSNTLKTKNSEYENELHNIQFITIPKIQPKDYHGFFINDISIEVYKEIKESLIEKKGVKGGYMKINKAILKFKNNQNSRRNNRSNIIKIRKVIKTRKI